MERIGSLVVTALTRTWVPDRNSWKDLVGKWPCYCTFMSQDDATRDESNRSSSCEAIASNGPKGRRANDLAVGYLRTKTNPKTSDEANRFSGCGVVVSASCDGWRDERTDGLRDRRRLFYSCPYFPSERRGTKMHAVHIHCDQNAICTCPN